MENKIIDWAVHFREDDHKVVYAKLNGQQVGASQNWRSGQIDQQDIYSLQEMLAAAYMRGYQDARADMRRVLGMQS